MLSKLLLFYLCSIHHYSTYPVYMFKPTHPFLPTTGPISSLICTRYSCRTSVALGSLLQAVGFILTGLVSDVLYVFITFGLCVGKYIGTL